MADSLGARVRMLRNQRGWSQEDLAERAGIDRRTIQRIESDEYDPSPGTGRALAAAFELDVSKLRVGFTKDSLAGFEEEYLCPHCGASLEARTFVDHEYGDVEFEVFRCGHTRGWQHRPCPKDPTFPRFEDYELTFVEEGDGVWWCYPSGQTKSAREVELMSGPGRSREEAERFVRRSYIQARDGLEAAEAQYSLFG